MNVRSIAYWLLGMVFGPIENAAFTFRFYLSSRDKNGHIQGMDGPIVNLEPPTFKALRLGFQGLMLCMILTTLWFIPGSIFFVPVMRVTTVGLNALLSSTLANSVTSTTWYVGLAKYVSNTGVTTTSTTFTDVNGTFAAGDVGRNILLRGAGTAGGDLLTTIAAVGSATSITLGGATTNSATGVQYALECRAADTMASHASFVESTTYSNSVRPTWTPGAVAAGSVSNTASQAVFNINGSDFIFGAFLVSDSTKGGSGGTLYGMGVNSAGVALAVTTGATVNVTITCTATAS